IVLSVMNGFEEELRTRILGLTAHATISGVEGRISGWRTQLSTLSRFRGIAAAAPYIQEQGMVTHGNQAAGILLRGIIPSEESRVANLTPALLSGRLADLVPGEFRVILGKDLAASIGAKVGDRVVVIVPQGDVTPVGVMPRMRAFQVVGILSVGMYEYDRRIGLFAMPDVAKLLRMGGDISGIRLNVGDMYAAPQIVRDAALTLGGSYLVEDWTTQHANFFRSIEITKHILFIMLSAVIAVAAFNIVSTMVMVVRNKRRDMAILRTVGSSPNSILSIFVVQGSLIGTLGIALGVLIGSIVALNLQSLVHGLEAAVGFKFLDARVYFMSDLPAHVHWSDVAKICTFAFFLTCLSTLYPAWRAARLPPAESLRND
ncbi:MAG: lipoprotein-releasing ABC transporter permease subunit, partial [Pseudomonadota bacterium]|nr:lipoprotein-releasing ABC transporter permease subunit [Pseudomonadota bacterium]